MFDRIFAFLRRLVFGDPAKPEPIVPTDWHEVQSRKTPAKVEEKVGPHIVREKLRTNDHGRLLVVEFNGKPDQAVYLKHYPLLTEGLSEYPELSGRLALQLEAA